MVDEKLGISIQSPRYWALLFSEKYILDEHSETSSLNHIFYFDFPGTEEDWKGGYSSILVALTKASPELDSLELTKLATGYQNIAEMQVKDLIVAVNSQDNSTIAGIGNLITLPFWEEGKIIVPVEMDIDVHSFSTRSGVFSSQPVQKLTPKQIDEIEIASAPTEECDDLISSFEDLIEAPFIETPSKDLKEDPGKLVKVFFGTCRNQINISQEKTKYGRDLSNISVGTCTVSIPPGHIQGDLERPFKYLWILEDPESEIDHFVLKETIPLSVSELLSQLKQAFGKATEKSAFIFIHGYNTSFEEASYRTAQLAYDLPFKGIASFFSWPSSGKKVSYPADEAKARSSAPELTKFISMILRNNAVDKLHLIAHSMGNLVLSECLSDIARDPKLAGALPIINQIVLAAPDIDQDEFERHLFPKFSKLGANRTLYSSDQDRPINLYSAKIRGSRPRLGAGGKNLFVSKDLDTIDASNVATKDNHSYMFDAKDMLNDLHYLLNFQMPPRDRRLRRILKKPLEYWIFPK